MGHKITLRLIFVYIATVTAMFFIVNALGQSRIRRSLLANRKNAVLQEAQMVAVEYGENYYRSGITINELKKQLTSIDHFLGMRVLLTNTAGVVFIDTGGKEFYTIERYIGSSTLTFEDITITEISREPLLLVSEPIVYDYQIRGYVCLAVSMQSIYQDAGFYVDTISLMILAFSLILLMVFVLIWFMTIWPVAKLKKAAIEYAKKNYKYKAPRFRAEYRDISEAMRVTAEEVGRLEEYQKKFIGNVSHDFRSPLTSIKGYLEAIKDGTIPMESAGRYLDIILFETERLTKLTEDLLSLSRMDNNDTLDITVFDINEVIKKTAASFEGTCTKKRITIELQFCDPEVLISADMGRIQQVLYNLLDNAIKFSNQDSTITISVNIKASKVFVSVKDSGIGIPKDAQKKVFERFYKTDASRGKDKRGTGLGLAIVKEIIDAHGENITLVSTEGVGTEFTFSMPLAEL
jgi:signal transduction histidine kinase